MPFCVAVSGGIASGKSSVCALIQNCGIEVIDADIIAREVVQPGQSALLEIAQQFGSQFIQADGHLDRALLRQHVFSNPADKIRLENILHPRIQAELYQQSQQARSAYALVAIPLLSPAIRKTAYAWLNRILVVEAPEEMQLQRIMARDGSTMPLAKAMIAAQLRFSERLPMADDVIINDASVAQLNDWATRLHGRYLQMAVKGENKPTQGS